MLSQGPITLSQEECSYVVFLRLQVFLPPYQLLLGSVHLAWCIQLGPGTSSVAGGRQGSRSENSGTYF